MGKHFKSFSAIFPIILQEKDDTIQILLHRRKILVIKTGNGI